MPKPLRNEFVLSDFVQQACDLVESQRLHPTEAVCKVARENALTPDMSRRVVHTLNRSMQQAHRLGCDSDIVCKTASFPIAIEEQVLESVFPHLRKAASVSHIPRTIPVADCYDRAPDPSLTKSAFLLSEISATAPEDLLQLQREAFGYTPVCTGCGADGQQTKFARFRDEKQSLTNRRAEAVIRVKQAERHMLSALGDLQAYFTQPPTRRVDLGQLEHFLQHDAFHKTAASQLREQLQLPDKACSLRNTPGFAQDWSQKPLSLFTAVKEAFQIYREAADAVESLNLTVKAAADTFQPPPKPPEPFPGLRLRLEPATTTPLRKLALSPLVFGMAGGATMEGLRASGLGKSNKELLQSVHDDVYTPQHMADLETVNTQVSLANLMHNDDTISGYPSPQVTSAFNEISETAPTLARNMAAVRPWLRRRLESGTLDSYDVKELLDAELALRRSRNDIQQNTAPEG